MFEELIALFSFDFIRRALISGVLIALCSALLGTPLVLKRYSMIGDGLSHVALGSLAVATALRLAPMSVALPAVIAAAFLLLRISESSKVKGDAAIAMISTGALAIGIFVISMTSGMNIDISNYLFGSILAVSRSDTIISVCIAAAVLLIYTLFFNRIFAISFDETFAAATGTNVKLFNSAIAVLTAVTIVVGMQLMGALLISSFIIFPTLSSMRVCRSFRSSVIGACIISVFTVVFGIILSCVIDSPTGASIVIINIAVYLLICIYDLLAKMFSRKA